MRLHRLLIQHNFSAKKCCREGRGKIAIKKLEDRTQIIELGLGTMGVSLLYPDKGDRAFRISFSFRREHGSIRLKNNR